MNMSLINKSLLISALAVSLSSLSAFGGGKRIEVGDSFPDLGTFGLEGKLPEDLKGKVLLVDFWASWCEPCKESFPAMEELHKKYAQKGLVILAVNVDDDVGAMKEFLKDHHASFTILHDASKKLVGTVNISSMPSSFILGPDGKVAAVHKGFHGKKTSQEYASEIEDLLSSRVASK